MPPLTLLLLSLACFLFLSDAARLPEAFANRISTEFLKLYERDTELDGEIETTSGTVLPNAISAAGGSSGSLTRLQEWSIDLRGFNLLFDGYGKEGEEGAQPDIKHTAGYFKLNRTHDARMFYFFFESRGDKDRDPLVLWMTGGPGCSSEIAIFYENGPWIINEDRSTLSWSEYGWDKSANMIFVDQPVNTGFSYSHDPRDMRHNEEGVSQDMYEFLQEFLEAHPNLISRPFFITGESYGGHYVPSVASRVQKGNREKEGPIQINLQGIAIGNGLTEPVIQYASYPDFAFEEKLISEPTYHVLKENFLMCEIAAKTCGRKGRISCAVAFFICGKYFETVHEACGDGDLNVYDVRVECGVHPLCYDMTAADDFLNLPSVREALGVGDRKWVDCSPQVYRAMLIDFMRDIEPKVPSLLEWGVKVLVYAGDKDLICNWLGNSRWVSSMPWYGQTEYDKSDWRDFVVAANSGERGREEESKVAGTGKGYGPLTFLRVFEAGHMVPMNQPSVALEMFTRFIRGEDLLAPAGSNGAAAAATDEARGSIISI